MKTYIIFTLTNFKKHLHMKYDQLKTEGKGKILPTLKNEAELLMNGAGLNGIAHSLFDQKNKGTDVPPYSDFIKAFEKYKDLTADQYKVQTLDNFLHFHVGDEI